MSITYGRLYPNKENQVKRITNQQSTNQALIIVAEPLAMKMLDISLSENEFINFIRAITFLAHTLNLKCNNLFVISVEKNHKHLNV